MTLSMLLPPAEMRTAVFCYVIVFREDSRLAVVVLKKDSIYVL